MENCLFCKIIAGTIPAQKVYEDDDTIVIPDIAPQAPVHFLAIPKVHVAAVHDITSDNADLMAHCMRAVSAVVKQEKLEESGGYRLVINAGPTARQSVPHIHVHILAGRLLGQSLG